MEEAVNAKIAELKAELERQHDETSQMVDEWLEETHQKVQDFTETNEEEDTSDILEDSLTLRSHLYMQEEEGEELSPIVLTLLIFLGIGVFVCIVMALCHKCNPGLEEYVNSLEEAAKA